MSLNTWNFIEFRRVNGTLTAYVNNVAVGSSPDATNYTSGTMTFGACSYTPLGVCQFSGYFDDIVIASSAPHYTDSYSLDTNTPASVTSYTYDAAGRVLSAKDSLNRTTNYSYYADAAFTGVDPNAVGHSIGDLQSITDPKGFVTTFNAYDKAGRIVQMTDAKGIGTAMTYTPRGWISSVSVTPPGGSARVTTYTYDNVGQLKGVNNPDGTTLSYTYDAAHRLVGATDASGNTVSYTLDNAGNRIAEQLKDPSGTLQRAINRSFDALNRVQQLQLQ